MRASDAPQATGIEVVATQPTKADRATLAMFESTERKTLPGAAYIVKVRLKTLPEPTSRGFALYVGGGLGAVPHDAKLFDPFLPEEELLPITQAIARVFARLGEKTPHRTPTVFQPQRQIPWRPSAHER